METRSGVAVPVLSQRLFGALFYGISSFIIIVVNKVVLTSYKFPSFQFLALGQLITTIVVLFIAKRLKMIHFPDCSKETIVQIFPLPLIYLANMVFGLAGTQKLSLPMFTVLRRFTILLTMIFEQILIGKVASLTIKLTVASMIIGALIAASDDLAFDLKGYVFILLNDLCTALNGVYTKKKLDTKNLGKYGLLYYNALFMLIPATLVIFINGEFKSVLAFESWSNPMFTVQFLMSCGMGFVLMYSIVLCTLYNSALTTTIVGVLKNLLVTYIGMFIGGDYVFSMVNFIGLNISALGSVVYTWITFKQKPPVSTTPVSDKSPV
ncbi:UDP-sugar transporter UST74c-like isoform X1 [Tubulanus polymorphus]|uniref:UDP-sugar transporter UST74c-like isoform X1 n=1 Tax=Tubulanus polymorphus TaxID=672921 RepID=UPI003DA38549